MGLFYVVGASVDEMDVLSSGTVYVMTKFNRLTYQNFIEMDDSKGQIICTHKTDNVIYCFGDPLTAEVPERQLVCHFACDTLLLRVRHFVCGDARSRAFQLLLVHCLLGYVVNTVGEFFVVGLKHIHFVPPLGLFCVVGPSVDEMDVLPVGQSMS